MQRPSANIVVGIATANRPHVLSHTISVLASQTRLPDRLMICPAKPADIDPVCLDSFPAPHQVVNGGVGLTTQRNAILSSLPSETDIVVFLDDDFFPGRDYLEQVERLFRVHPDVMALTGRPVEDGVNGPGISPERGLSIIENLPDGKDGDTTVTDTFGTYGCNMAFRLAPARRLDLRFDENLPLYGWQEDIDFSSGFSKFGRVVESKLLKGVHLGAKNGRPSGIKFGYSQVANPVYLIRKGTMTLSFALPLIVRNIAANVLHTPRPEPWIDRRGRLKGNLIALADLLLCRSSPKRILDL